MKKNSVNTFTEGLICDLDPINVPNNVLTDCLNGTIITYDGNEYSLQNDKGNYPLTDCKLKENFIPVGIKEYNGILYIVSMNPLTGEEEIGSYPSPKPPVKRQPTGSLDIDYVIQPAFEELASNEVDYEELESRCKRIYYSDPLLKINVGDKIKFDYEGSIINTFEKIENYIIDENSSPHLISNDWLNSSGEYVSSVSGMVFLKNKIFEFANSSVDTNTFVCWSEASEESDLTNNEEADTEYAYMKIYDDSNDWSGEYVLAYRASNQLLVFTELDKPADTDLSSSQTDINVIPSSIGDKYSLTIIKNGMYYNIMNSKKQFLCYSNDDDHKLLWGTANNNAAKWFIQYYQDNVYIRPLLDPNYRIRYGSEFNTSILEGGNVSLFKKESVIDSSARLTTLLSFTYKLYVDDADSLLWIKNDDINYKVDVKINDTVIHSHTYSNSLEHVDQINSSIKHPFSVESTPAIDLDWYANNKIISKHFTGIIKNISVLDEIYVEITPIIKLNDSQQIIISKLKKQLNNSISDHVSINWSIGKDYWKYYNHPENNGYVNQFIEFDIKGPIEANDDMIFKYSVYSKEDVNKTYAIKQETPKNILIGKNVLTIPYDDIFKKESWYTITCELLIAGISIYSITKPVITSELFNKDYLSTEYSHYTNISTDVIKELYREKITLPAINITSAKLNKEFTMQRYEYNSRSESIFFRKDLRFPSFITDDAYIKWAEVGGDSLMHGELYDCTLQNISPTTLEGELWSSNISNYLVDDLGNNLTENDVQIPVGYGLNFTISWENDTVGEVTDYYRLGDATKTLDYTFGATLHSGYPERLEVYIAQNNSKIWNRFISDSRTTERITITASELNFREQFDGELVKITTKNTFDEFGYGIDNEWSVYMDYAEGATLAAQTSTVGFKKCEPQWWVVESSSDDAIYENGWWIYPTPSKGYSYNGVYMNYFVSVSSPLFGDSEENNTHRFDYKVRAELPIKVENDLSGVIEEIQKRTTRDKEEFIPITQAFNKAIVAGQSVKGVIKTNQYGSATIEYTTLNYVFDEDGNKKRFTWETNADGYVEIRCGKPSGGQTIIEIPWNQL